MWVIKTLAELIAAWVVTVVIVAIHPALITIVAPVVFVYLRRVSKPKEVGP